MIMFYWVPAMSTSVLGGAYECYSHDVCFCQECDFSFGSLIRLLCLTLHLLFSILFLTYTGWLLYLFLSSSCDGDGKAWMFFFLGP